MLYAIIADDHPGSLANRRAHRPAHLARLQALQAEGRLVLAGPRPLADSADPGDAGFSGSLVVAEFANLQAAQDWAAADPFIAHGVYARVSVYPFIKALPA